MRKIMITNFGIYSKKIKKRKSFICGIKGLKLNYNEIKFLKKHKPWGIILFSRNIKTVSQTKKLTDNIRNIFSDENYPILIDEEGGRVSRLKSIIDNSLFTAKYFGSIYKTNNKKFNLYLKIYIEQISYLLNILGININTVPVLDLNIKGMHKIIGDRAYSSNPNIVSAIGDITINNFHKNKIATVIKHIPGHGNSLVDSHKKLPIINKNKKYLIKKDFFAFKKKNSLFAMTGHLKFQKIDKNYCVTHSKILIDIIRKKIGFRNILITDDISMKSLKLPLSTNVKKAITAGCNLILHCNGNMREMKIVAKNSNYLSNFVIKKTSKFYKIIS